MKGRHFRNMEVETSLELAKPSSLKCFSDKADYGARSTLFYVMRCIKAGLVLATSNKV